jgi:hypothetical protein
MSIQRRVAMSWCGFGEPVGVSPASHVMVEGRRCNAAGR